ncbi:MAG: NTP transferase domain-containing protein [Candidatus Verstraetearchaeota archaeon]|nr:NTP transferase domain-containing protein [Candidatus Verstraetearchaeota archaeon]
MKFIGLVMAGGKGSRLNAAVEKPLMGIGKKPMVAYVIDALRKSSSICEIYVAVSPHTPETKSYALSIGAISVIDTPGLDYHNDMRCAIKRIGGGHFVVVSADLPLLKPETIEEAIMAYKAQRRPSLTVVAPLRFFEEMGLDPTWILEIGEKKFVPCGINILDGAAIDEPYIDETFFVAHDPSICINVNTLHDLSIAEKLINYRTDKPSYK